MDVVNSIENALDYLEDVLAPLLNMPLTSAISKLDLLQRAKLQVLLPYVVNDLIFIYLKTRDINPKDHAVVAELDRVKQYFDKIKKAEAPEKRKFLVDQEAATRFIKHAIKEVQIVQEQTATMFPPQRNAINVITHGAVPSKAATAKIEARNTEHDNDTSDQEDEQLHVYGEKENNVVEDKFSGMKRRRRMDPWKGYDDQDPQTEQTEQPSHKKSRNIPIMASSTMPPNPIVKKRKPKRKKPQTAAELSSISAPAQSQSP